MRLPIAFLLIALAPMSAAEEGWTSLFDGKDLRGWKPNENVETFSIKDGAIVAHGQRSHCFYMGDFRNHKFKDFELKVDVMTLPGSNGGIYIDTEYQEKGWPGKGFEVQVNNTYNSDKRKTGSLYEVKDNGAEVAKDNEWFTEHIIAKGNTITIMVNDKWSPSGRSRRIGQARRTSRAAALALAPSRCKGTTQGARFITGTSGSNRWTSAIA